jgi:hypothetical protein
MHQGETWRGFQRGKTAAAWIRSAARTLAAFQREINPDSNKKVYEIRVFRYKTTFFDLGKCDNV